jgi:hypothetical protein
VAGADDVEVETTRMLVKESTARHGWVFALAVDAVPRREKQFVLRLRNVYQLVGNTRFPVPLGDITFSNPHRSHVALWRAAPAPQRVVTKEFECELKRCDLHLDTLMGTPLWLDWRFTEGGKPVDHWKVQRIELEDATGNILYQSWWDGPATDREASSAGWVRRCLFPGSGAWKVRAHILRTADFPSNEVVEVRDMPVPLQPGHATTLCRSEVDGGALEIGSYMALSQSRLGVPQIGFPSLDNLHADWVTVLFGTTDLTERTRLVSLEDDRGRPGVLTRTWASPEASAPTRPFYSINTIQFWSTPGPRIGAEATLSTQFTSTAPTAPWTAHQTWSDHRLAAWRRDWETNAVSCTLRLGVSRWRVVEFLVEPTLIAPPVGSTAPSDSGIARQEPR